MALINCRNCGKPVSDRAVRCPHCGADIKQGEPQPPIEQKADTTSPPRRDYTRAGKQSRPKWNEFLSDEENLRLGARRRASRLPVILLIIALLLCCGAGGWYYFSHRDTGEDHIEWLEVRDILEENGYINGHEYVDLGLSVKWATCNVGASSPEGYGDYFAWGETSTKSSYDRDNCRTYEVSMGSIAGNASYDAARANWGGTWRLPTYDEIGELVNKCQRTWTTMGGHNGYKVTGPNGNSIFLPAAGWRDGTSLLSLAGEHGFYWSATPCGNDAQGAYRLGFLSGFFDRYWGRRLDGISVRPVSE